MGGTDKLSQYNDEVGLEAEAKAKAVTDKWDSEFKLLYNNIENNYHHIKSLEKVLSKRRKIRY